MVQHESRVLRRRKEILQSRPEAEVAAAMNAQHAIRPRRPVFHDGLEIDNVARCQQSIHDGLVRVVAADEVVQAAVEAARVVVEARGGDLHPWRDGRVP